MLSRVRRWWLGGLVLALLTVTVAVLLTENAPQADRAYALQQQLRCPVCKSVSIAESPSETAVSLRRIVEEQVDAGRSDEEIIAYFTDRYGTWVLLDPPARGPTLLLWVLPLLVAVGGVIVFATRARRPPEDPPELDAAQRDRLQTALHEYRWRADEEEP